MQVNGQSGSVNQLKAGDKIKLDKNNAEFTVHQVIAPNGKTTNFVLMADNKTCYSVTIEDLRNEKNLHPLAAKDITANEFKMADTPPMSMDLNTGKLIINGKPMSLKTAMADPHYREMLTMKGSTFFSAIKKLEETGKTIEFMDSEQLKNCKNLHETISELEQIYTPMFTRKFGFSSRTDNESIGLSKQLDKFIAQHTQIQGSAISVFGKKVVLPSDDFPAKDMKKLRENLLAVLSGMVKTHAESNVFNASFVRVSFYNSMTNSTADKLQPPIITKTGYPTEFQSQSAEKKSMALALAYVGGQMGLVKAGEGQGVITTLKASVTGAKLPGAVNKDDVKFENKSIKEIEAAKADVLKHLHANPKPANWDKINNSFMISVNSTNHSPKTQLMYLYALLIVKENLLSTKGNHIIFENQKIIDLIGKGTVFTHEEAINISHLANAIYGTSMNQGTINEPGSIMAKVTSAHLFLKSGTPGAESANAYLYGKALADGVNVNDILSLRLILDHQSEITKIDNQAKENKTNPNQTILDKLNKNLTMAEDSRAIANNTDNNQESIKIYHSLMGDGPDKIMANDYQGLPDSIKKQIISQYNEKISDLQSKIQDAVRNEAFDTANKISSELFSAQNEMDNKLQAEAYKLYESKLTQDLQINTSGKTMDKVIDENRSGLKGAAQTFFQSNVTKQSKMRQLAFIYAQLDKNQPEKQMKFLNELFPNEKTDPVAKQNFIKFVAYNQLREMTDITNEYTTMSDSNTKQSKEFLSELGVTIAGGIATEVASGGLATPLVATRVVALARYLTRAGVDARLVRAFLASSKLGVNAVAFHATANVTSDISSANTGKQSQADWTAMGFVHSAGNLAIFGGAGKLSEGFMKNLLTSTRNEIIATLKKQGVKNITNEMIATAMKNRPLGEILTTAFKVQGVRATPEFTAMVSMEYLGNIFARDGIVTDEEKFEILKEATLHSAQFMGGMRVAHLPQAISKRLIQTAEKMANEASAGKISAATKQEYEDIKTELKATDATKSEVTKRLNNEDIYNAKDGVKYTNSWLKETEKRIASEKTKSPDTQSKKVPPELSEDYDNYLKEMKEKYPEYKKVENLGFKDINPENITNLEKKARSEINELESTLKVETALGGSLLTRTLENGEVISTAIGEPSKPMDVDVRIFAGNKSSEVINNVESYLKQKYTDSLMPGTEITAKDQSAHFGGQKAMLFKLTTKDGLEFEFQVRPGEKKDYVGVAATRMALKPDQILEMARLKKALKGNQAAYKELKKKELEVLNKIVESFKNTKTEVATPNRKAQIDAQIKKLEARVEELNQDWEKVNLEEAATEKKANGIFTESDKAEAELSKPGISEEKKLALKAKVDELRQKWAEIVLNDLPRLEEMRENLVQTRQEIEHRVTRSQNLSLGTTERNRIALEKSGFKEMEKNNPDAENVVARIAMKDGSVKMITPDATMVINIAKHKLGIMQQTAMHSLVQSYQTELQLYKKGALDNPPSARALMRSLEGIGISPELLKQMQEKGFENIQQFSDKDWHSYTQAFVDKVLSEQEGENARVYHSHPKGNKNTSETDTLNGAAGVITRNEKGEHEFHGTGKKLEAGLKFGNEASPDSAATLASRKTVAQLQESVDRFQNQLNKQPRNATLKIELATYKEALELKKLSDNDRTQILQKDLIAVQKDIEIVEASLKEYATDTKTEKLKALKAEKAKIEKDLGIQPEPVAIKPRPEVKATSEEITSKKVPEIQHANTNDPGLQRAVKEKDKYIEKIVKENKVTESQKTLTDQQIALNTAFENIVDKYDQLAAKLESKISKSAEIGNADLTEQHQALKVLKEKMDFINEMQRKVAFERKRGNESEAIRIEKNLNDFNSDFKKVLNGEPVDLPALSEGQIQALKNLLADVMADDVKVHRDRLRQQEIDKAQSAYADESKLLLKAMREDVSPEIQYKLQKLNDAIKKRDGIEAIRKKHKAETKKLTPIIDTMIKGFEALLGDVAGSRHENLKTFESKIETVNKNKGNYGILENRSTYEEIIKYADLEIGEINKVINKIKENLKAPGDAFVNKPADQRGAYELNAIGMHEESIGVLEFQKNHLEAIKMESERKIFVSEFLEAVRYSEGVGPENRDSGAIKSGFKNVARYAIIDFKAEYNRKYGQGGYEIAKLSTLGKYLEQTEAKLDRLGQEGGITYLELEKIVLTLEQFKNATPDKHIEKTGEKLLVNSKPFEKEILFNHTTGRPEIKPPPGE